MNGSLVARLLIRIALGLGFLWAGASKFSEPSNFASLIANYDILAPAGTHLTSLVLPRLELIIGSCLLLGFFTQAAALLSGVLSLLFGVAISSALYRGLEIDCGCFGAASAVSWTHVLLNLAMFAASVWLLLQDPKPPSLDQKLGSHHWKTQNLALYLVLPVILVAGLLVADALTPVSTETSPNEPVIEFSPTTLVFGKVNQGEVIQSEISYKNISNRTLILDHVEASCGCTTASPVKFRLEPGESTPMRVSLATETKLGPTTNQVKVFFQGMPEGLSFSVTADVLPIVSIDPMLIRPQLGKPSIVTVTSTDSNSDLEIEKVLSPLPALLCRVLKSTEKGRVQIEVTTQEKLPRPDPPMDAWTIEIHTNRKGLPPFSLYVQP